MNKIELKMKFLFEVNPPPPNMIYHHQSYVLYYQKIREYDT